MTDADIIRIAQEAGITLYTRVPIRNKAGELVIEKCWHDRPTGCLFDFAQRVRSATIAECAAVIDKRADILEKISDPTNPSVTNCRLAAAAIRALDGE